MHDRSRGHCRKEPLRRSAYAGLVVTTPCNREHDTRHSEQDECGNDNDEACVVDV